MTDQDESGGPSPIDGDRIQTPGKTLARNSLINTLGGIIQIVVLVTILPAMIGNLGVVRYGIYSLLTILLIYVSTIDFGMSRAASKFAAEAVSKGLAPDLKATFWISTSSSLVIGIATGAALIASAPLLIDHAFQIPETLRPEATTSLRILALSVPSILVSLTLIGILEAHQRFMVINLLRVPSTILNSLLPLTAVLTGHGLVAVGALLSAKNAIFMVLFIAACLIGPPRIRGGFLWNRDLARSIFSFGGWANLHTIVTVAIGNLERPLLAAFGAIASVTYYAVPQQVINGMSLLIGGVIPVLFPAFSQLYELHPDRLEELLRNALKCIILIMGSAVFLLVLCSRELLFLWMGPTMEPSIPVLQLLAPILMLGSVGWLLTSLLQATRYAKTASLIVVALLAIQIAAISVLVPRMGVVGAALGTLLMNAIGVVLLVWAVRKKRIVALSRVMDSSLILGVLVLASLLGGVYLLKSWWAPGPALGIGIPTLALMGYWIFGWHRILNSEIRGYILKTLRYLVSFERRPRDSARKSSPGQV